MSSIESSQFRPEIGSKALAGGASLLLPGLGQFLTGRYIRAAVFFILWVVLLVETGLLYTNPDKISKVPLQFVWIFIVMLVAAVDAFYMASRHQLKANADARIYGLVGFAGAIIVAIWFYVDMGKAIKDAGSLGKFISGTLFGTYFLMVIIGGTVAGALTLMHFFTRDKISAGVLRFGLGLLIPGLIFWPLDKIAQGTIISLNKTTVSWEGAFVGNSMIPTINDGETVFIHKKAPLKRFDMVAIVRPDDKDELAFEAVLKSTKTQREYQTVEPTTIKRVYGLPGETVEVYQGWLFINGEEVPLPEGLPKLDMPQMEGMPCIGAAGNPITLGKDEYYVLGDNPRASFDSRFRIQYPIGNFEAASAVPHQKGAIPRDKILGRVTYRLSAATPWSKK